MTPPSRCWTVLRLVSAVTMPGATAALDSGASVAQAQKPPNPATARKMPAASDPPDRRFFV